MSRLVDGRPEPRGVAHVAGLAATHAEPQRWKVGPIRLGGPVVRRNGSKTQGKLPENQQKKARNQLKTNKNGMEDGWIHGWCMVMNSGRSWWMMVGTCSWPSIMWLSMLAGEIKVYDYNMLMIKQNQRWIKNRNITRTSGWFMMKGYHNTDFCLLMGLIIINTGTLWQAKGCLRMFDDDRWKNQLRGPSVTIQNQAVANASSINPTIIRSIAAHDANWRMMARWWLMISSR